MVILWGAFRYCGRFSKAKIGGNIQPSGLGCCPQQLDASSPGAKASVAMRPVLHVKRGALLLGCSKGCRVLRAHLKGFSSPFFLPKAGTVILEASCVKCTHRLPAATIPTCIYLTHMLSLILEVDMKDGLPLSCLQQPLHVGALLPCPGTAVLPIWCHTNKELLKHLSVCSSRAVPQQELVHLFLIRHHGHTKHDLGT